MTQTLVEQAARNNALWCDAVCTAHGHPGEFHDALWLNRSGTPRFYPDAVTIAGPHAAPEQLRILSGLIEHSGDRGWAVKDSFSSLDLGALGFRPLFDAEWIGLSSDANVQPLPAQYRYTDMRSALDLAAWEHALNDGDTPDGRIFKPSLLSHRHILFVSITSEGRIVGGGILNEGGGVVGLSNLFARDIEPEIVWRGLDRANRRCISGPSFGRL